MLANSPFSHADVTGFDAACARPSDHFAGSAECPAGRLTSSDPGEPPRPIDLSATRDALASNLRAANKTGRRVERR